MSTGGKVINLIGQRFGRLTVLEQAKHARRRESFWRCKCQCGGELITSGYYLRKGLTASCGCLKQERSRDASATHGHCGLPEFNAWRSIVRRCNDPSHPGYSTHGACGIRYCWTTFDEFVADVGERPSPLHCLYRLDRDGNFEQSNCAWLTPKEHYRLCPGAYAHTLRGRKR